MKLIDAVAIYDLPFVTTTVSPVPELVISCWFLRYECARLATGKHYLTLTFGFVWSMIHFMAASVRTRTPSLMSVDKGGWFLVYLAQDAA